MRPGIGEQAPHLPPGQAEFLCYLALRTVEVMIQFCRTHHQMLALFIGGDSRTISLGFRRVLTGFAFRRHQADCSNVVSSINWLRPYVLPNRLQSQEVNVLGSTFVGNFVCRSATNVGNCNSCAELTHYLWVGA